MNSGVNGPAGGSGPIKASEPEQDRQLPIDWQEVYARLDRARKALEAEGERPLEAVRRILKERALALARPPEEAPAPDDLIELLVFSLAGEQYAIEAAHVLEVFPLRELTPVPSTPPFVLGLANHRGRVLAVLDLRRLFEIGGQGTREGDRVTAVEVGGMRFGILAEAVVGTTRIPVQELAPPPATLAGNHQGFIRGVTAAMIAVLDLEALARDPTILVNEEPA